MQGWAIVENTGESDWDDVTLSLVSGQPISFTMDLYTPLFVPRPTAQVPRFASLSPRLYDEGLGEAREMLALKAGRAGEGAAGRPMSRTRLNQPAAAAPQAAAEAADANWAAGRAFNDNLVAFDADGSGVAAATSTGDLGELFRFTIDHAVDLDRRRSAMLPIVTQPIQAEKLSIYNQSVQAKHPLHGARLTNDTGLKLLGGPITVFDGGAYAGDALIEHLGEGESRLISYGMDLDVTVDPSARHHSRVVGAKIVKGVLQVDHRSVFEQTYKIDNGGKEEKVVIVEHPTEANRKLLEPADYTEKTPNLYRFRVPVAAGTLGQFKVVEERTHTQGLAILNFDLGTFASYLRTGEIPQDVRAALEEAATLKRELTELERQRDETQAELEAIQSGQQRLRENIRAVGNATELRNRYLAKLQAEEDRIDELNGQLIELREQVDAQRKRLEDYLANLSVG